MKKKKIQVENKAISIISHNEKDYISLTDMIRSEDKNFFISDWLRNKNTLEYISEWEKIHNPNFNYGEFATITSQAGKNSFKVSIKDLQKANITSIFAKTGRYGGTYAHRDIAFNFGMWISPSFQLYLVKEYQRLKEIEIGQSSKEWDIRRLLSKTNYVIHTDAVKEHIIPKTTKPKGKEWLEYAEEADLLNVALFGYTAKEWREVNQKAANKGLNMRDFASINELIVLSNIESINATMIEKSIDKITRFKELQNIGLKQLSILDKTNASKSIKRVESNIHINDKN